MSDTEAGELGGETEGGTGLHDETAYPPVLGDVEFLGTGSRHACMVASFRLR